MATQQRPSDGLWICIGQPCRPGGVALDCCKLDISRDPRGLHPIYTTCEMLAIEAKNCFEIEGGCVKNSNGNYPNTMSSHPNERAVSTLFRRIIHYFLIMEHKDLSLTHLAIL